MKTVANSIFLAAAFTGVCAFAASGEDLGAVTYNQYCATCHGVDGTGGGPLTELLTVTPPDLSQLSVNNNGMFPMLQVIHVIDGRTGLRAHGAPMPVYGAIFEDEVESGGPYGAVAITRGRILSLAYHLEAMQEN